MQIFPPFDAAHTRLVMQKKPSGHILIRGLFSYKTFLTLKVPITTVAEDNFFFTFQRKQVFTFHVNCLLSRQFT